MEDKLIVTLKDGCPRVAEDPEASGKIRTYVLELFIKSGIHRGMSEERFNEEVEGTSTMLYNDIVSDRMYYGLRTTEIGYIFDNGLKGRLSKNPDLTVTYKTIINWIENYVSHPVYRDALSMMRNRPAKPSQQIEQHKFDDSDAKRMVVEAYHDYLDYRNGMCTVVDSDSGSSSPSHVGEILRLPISCFDFGKIRTNWLVKNGYASEGESITSVFDRAIKNKQFIKIK